MNLLLLTALYSAGLLAAMLIIVEKRKKLKGNKGFRSYLTPLCFLGISLLAFLTAVTDRGGITSVGLICALLVVGAYCTKYLPVPREERS
ncbi:hypothetical protein [Jeotgalibacillus proteolyticus]|uniref:Uncharacterized protein n=1 Tax=Jeotgalibacillus proteolyticus TaxID=2082395 RepID=A0A2S5GCW1_9BACL|nr:hypothetical protein [Jeotgalibacillus proteolyticus]PPA70744.1 hypothetical protein C4B60_08095 [Jeotgalibacillus proteolyticus]